MRSTLLAPPVLCLLLALSAPSAVFAGDDPPPAEAAPDDAPDVQPAPPVDQPTDAGTPPSPAALWPTHGRDACPSLQACCVPGEAVCVHPGLSRLLLAGFSGVTVGVGAALYVAGDTLDSGDPMTQLVGGGLVGLAGAAFGLVSGLLAPRGEGTVRDRPARPTLVVGLSPGGSSTVDEASPYGLSVRADPRIVVDARFSMQPHVGVSVDLGQSRTVDPRPQNSTPLPGQGSTFPVTLSTHRTRVTVGAELSARLPYPLAVKRPLYAGAVELRWRPRWEVRRRVLHPGTSSKQVVEHSALYPANIGLLWHVSPRQRFSFYVGPRVDWISYSDPGSVKLRRGRATLGSFYAEAWWQLDVPLTPLGRRKTAASARLNIGYIHSNLDGKRLDFGAVVGYLGPIELAVDLRLRRVGSPVAIQLTGGWEVSTGGGPFIEIGLVTPTIGGGGA